MPELTSIMSHPEERRIQIRDKIIEGLQESFPIKSRNKTVEISDVSVDAKEYGSTAQKDAILKGETLFENVKGTVRMRDEKGKVIDEVKNFTLARVPYFTPRHTFIIGGNEYSVSNMVRRKPGVYARKRANGILEAAFNTHGGSNFRVSMDPAKGLPQLEYGATRIPMYSVLRHAGVPHDTISKSWGKRLADKNQQEVYSKATSHVDKLYAKELPVYKQNANATTQEKMKEILARYRTAEMDPEVNRQTLGKPYKNVTPDALLDASSKVLRIFNDADEVDDQDNLDFKRFVSVDDLFKERIKLDARDIARKAAIKMEGTPSLKKALPSAPFTRGLIDFMNKSQLVSVPTQTNPMELIDSAVRVTSLGEGGISTERAIPIEARQIHPTQMGAIDPIRTPETFRAGIDVRTSMLTKRDREGNIYVPVNDVKNKNKQQYIRAGHMMNKIVAFPNQEMKGTVDALVKGELRKVPASRVDYQVPSSSAMYSPTTNLVPFLESIQGNRGVMGSKMQVQALSLVDREAPFVQVKTPTNASFEEMAAHWINPVSPVAGTVAKVDKDFIYIRPNTLKTGAARKPKDDGLIKIPYNKDFPLAAKTYLDHTLTVKAGDSVKKDQLLADSNFTRNGTLALGKNMRVAFVPYYGANVNDALVISEDAAKKLTSERMYTITVPRDSDLTLSRAKHNTYYGHNYNKDKYKNLDEEGVIKPGSKIDPKDPLVVGLRKTPLTADDLILGKLHRSLAKPYREYVNDWDHEHGGEVIDVYKTPKRISFTVKTREPATVGDKLAGRYGNKGVISQIVPTEKMMRDADGNTIDILMPPSGIVTRINPGQIIETAVGKVVAKTGKPIKVESFSGRNNVQWAKDLLKEHKLTDKETIFDPVSGKHIPKVFVGNQYMLKLFKSTETNYGARGVDNYDVNQQPTKGGVQSAKALGKMEFDALIGHNARNILRDAATIKSQRNDEYWRALQLGYPTPPPKSTFAADKFLGMLRGSGVRVDRNSHKLALGPLTDKDVLEMSSGEIKDSKIVRAKDLMPEKGGLFDPAITGGLKGEKWSHINLAEPIINPVFKEPVRRLLNMTNTELDKTLRDKGAKHIQSRLAGIDIDKEEKAILQSMKGRKADQLDNEVKKVKYLRSLKKLNLSPAEAYIVNRIPVTPPVFRPVLPSRGGGQLLYGDSNPLYQDLIYINNQMKEVKSSRTPDIPGEIEKLRPVLQEAVGAVYGTNEPVTAKSKARGHKGHLTYLAGKGSPKFGFFQSKLMSRTQDVAGRGTIVPDVTLGMDEVGIPEDMMWTMYNKFLVRKLVNRGYPALTAKKMIEEKQPVAREALLQEAKERPVLINRAPTLHRYNIVAAFPKLSPGKTIRVNPFIEKAQNADYDGDTDSACTPVSYAAVEEAKGMTLSNILYSDKSKSDLLVFPQHETIMGIDIAANTDDKNTPVKFKDRAEAMNAYNSGKIGIGTRVKIGKG